MSTTTYPATYPAPAYPVRVDARLEEGLSRWLWLVKWLLAIPHYVVLAFLWIAYVVTGFVALVAIVATGRYPRALFDFNVGVLRWTWRVAYYAYGGLGTDQYPPFTLQDVPDYPAHLEVPYPEHLSRGLALVKWWLLAIPHYVVVGILVGGGWWATSAAEGDTERLWSSGLIEFLVLVAAVVLLVTGRYPRTIFDLVLGLNRWVLRVTAYASLMTDQYPPFRLDMGGQDPGSTLLAPSATPLPETAPGAPGGGPGGGPAYRRPPHWTAGRVVGAVIASLVALAAVGFLLASAGLALTDRLARDDDGYISRGPVAVTSAGHAVVLSAEVHVDGADVLDLPRRLIGTVKVSADGGDRTLFVGLARTGDAEAYLAGVARSMVTDLAGADARPIYDQVAGTRVPAPPGEQTFWKASSSGPGSSVVTAEAEEGDWTVVVMNADGSAGVDADLRVGATVPGLADAALVCLVVGVVLASLATLGLLLAAPRSSRDDRADGADRPDGSAGQGHDG